MAVRRDFRVSRAGLLLNMAPWCRRARWRLNQLTKRNDLRLSSAGHCGVDAIGHLIRRLAERISQSSDIPFSSAHRAVAKHVSDDKPIRSCEGGKCSYGVSEVVHPAIC